MVSSQNDVSRIMANVRKQTMRTVSGRLPDEESLRLDSVYTPEQWETLHAAIFDDSRALESLRDYARAAGVAPVAMLVVVLTRLAAASYPILFDVGLGPTPLNLFAVLVGDSGMGKDVVIRRAAGAYSFVRDGVSVKSVERPLGSGNHWLQRLPHPWKRRGPPRSRLNTGCYSRKRKFPTPMS